MAYLSVDSASGVRFLASVREGKSLKLSARAAGVHLEVGYRWRGQRYFEIRRQGLVPEAAQAEMGCWSTRATQWEAQWLASQDGGDRHHLAVPAEVEQAFWAYFTAGLSVDQARLSASIGRGTAYRWLQRQFVVMRQDGQGVTAAARPLRLPISRARVWEESRARRWLPIDTRRPRGSAARCGRRPGMSRRCSSPAHGARLRCASSATGV